MTQGIDSFEVFRISSSVELGVELDVEAIPRAWISAISLDEKV